MKKYRTPRELLSEIAGVLSSKTPPPGKGAPLQDVVDALASGRHYFWTAVYLVLGEQVVCHASRGPACNRPVVSLGEGLVGKVAQSATYVAVPDVSENKDYLRCFAETRSELVVPIKIGAHVLGVINVESDKLYGLPSEDRVLLEETAAQLARFLAGRGKYVLMKAREKFVPLPSDDKPITAKLNVRDLPFLKPEPPQPEAPRQVAAAAHATVTTGDRSRS